jgi:hypothetical protein
MAEPSEDHIRLRLVTPNYDCETHAPAQIMEADNEEGEEIPEAENKYIIPDLAGADGEPHVPNSENHDEDDGEEAMVVDENEPEEISEAEEEEKDEDEPLSDPELDDKDGPISEIEELSDGEVKSPLPPMETEDRITLLEGELKRSKARMDGFSQELKILLVEVNIVCDWITDNFGKGSLLGKGAIS